MEDIYSDSGGTSSIIEAINALYRPADCHQSRLGRFTCVCYAAVSFPFLCKICSTQLLSASGGRFEVQSLVASLVCHLNI